MKGQTRGYAVRADQTGGPITFLLATENLARDNQILVLDGLDTRAYEANPVVTWAHDLSGQRLPIGRTTRLARTAQGLEATMQFDSADDPFAAQVEGKIRRGYINACSISWDSLKTNGNRIEQSEMLEAAIVPVPGDAACLAMARSAYARAHRAPARRPSVDVRALAAAGYTDDEIEARMYEENVLRPRLQQIAAGLDRIDRRLTGLRDTQR